MKTEGLIIPAKRAIENKSSIEKNKTSNPKNEKNVQSQSTTNTKLSKKERPKTLLKKGVQKTSNFISFKTLLMKLKILMSTLIPLLMIYD